MGKEFLFENISNFQFSTMTAAAAVIVVRRRRRRREQHQRDAWSLQWLLNRTSARETSNFVDYELSDDTLGFHSFLHMGSSEFNDILNEIAGDIMRMDTVIRDSLTPKDRLVLPFDVVGFVCFPQQCLLITH